MDLLERVVVTNWKVQGGGFGAPVVMLCYYVGQQVFEEYVDKERWDTYKETTRWGQLPVFSLEYREGTLKDGNTKVFTNSVPTLRALGKMWGYYFTQLKQQYQYEADMWIDVGRDCFECLRPSLKMKDVDEKLALRKELMSENGRLYSWFSKFDKELSVLFDNTNDNNDNNEVKFLVNNTVSIADFHFFSTINSIVCGWMDGIDKSFLEKFTHLNKWYTLFLEHYKKRLESNPKKEEYPYIVHKGRFYVYGKDQTEFWANENNKISKEDVDKMNFSGVGYDDDNVINMKVNQEEFKNLNIKEEDLKKIKKEVSNEVIEEYLTTESTLGEVENASVKLLKNTLKKHNVSLTGVTEKHHLIDMVKYVLTNPENPTPAESV